MPYGKLWNKKNSIAPWGLSLLKEVFMLAEPVRTGMIKTNYFYLKIRILLKIIDKSIRTEFNSFLKFISMSCQDSQPISHGFRNEMWELGPVKRSFEYNFCGGKFKILIVWLSFLLLLIIEDVQFLYLVKKWIYEHDSSFSAPSLYLFAAWINRSPRNTDNQNITHA